MEEILKPRDKLPIGKCDHVGQYFGRGSGDAGKPICLGCGETLTLRQMEIVSQKNIFAIKNAIKERKGENTLGK